MAKNELIFLIKRIYISYERDRYAEFFFYHKKYVGRKILSAHKLHHKICSIYCVPPDHELLLNQLCNELGTGGQSLLPNLWGFSDKIINEKHIQTHYFLTLHVFSFMKVRKWICRKDSTYE